MADEGLFEVALGVLVLWRSRNSRTKGSLICSPGTIWSSERSMSPPVSMEALFLERAVRS